MVEALVAAAKRDLLAVISVKKEDPYLGFYKNSVSAIFRNN